MLAVLLSTTPAAAQEKVFVYSMPGEPETLDSAKASSERSIWATWLLCDALVNISKDGQHLEPGLAESWSLSLDGLQAKVKLRSGVLFQDGRPVDAAAVKASFERQFRTDHELYSPSPRNTKEKLLSELIADIQVHDPLTLTFRLRYPGFHYLSQVDIVSPAAVAKLGKDFARRPVCTGPFRVADWTAEQLSLTANERYWAGRPRIDRVAFRFIAEARAVADGLLRGNVDFTPSVRDPVLFERLRESDRVRLLTVPGLNLFYLGFYTDRPPFDNAAARRAVAHAINVPRLVLFLGRGAAVAARGPLSPAMKGYDPAVSQAAYDPPVARELLAKAWLDSGRPITLVHDTAVTMDAEIATAIQGDLRRLGLTVELLGKPRSTDVVAAVRNREGDAFLYSWHIRAPYPERLLLPLFHSSAADSTNLTRYKNALVDKLLDEVLRTPEGPSQQAIYTEVQRVLAQDAPMVFLYHLTRMAVHGRRVRGLELNLGALPHDKLVTVDLAR